MLLSVLNQSTLKLLSYIFISIILVGCSSPRSKPTIPTTTNNSITLPTVNPTEIITAHNRIRSQYQLPKLSWSNELANFSQQWADYLKLNNHCNMQHRPHSGSHKTNYGENLFWASPLTWSDGRVEIQKFSGTTVVNDWASEVDFYNYRNNQCQKNQQCGHYTQIVWKDSRKVGCARAICSDSSQVWVCSYDPPGNWVGQHPY